MAFQEAYKNNTNEVHLNETEKYVYHDFYTIWNTIFSFLVKVRLRKIINSLVPIDLNIYVRKSAGKC